MTRQKTSQTLPSSAHPARFRSGAVARMAGMPVSTLRVWEQRYQVVGPTTAASGHRLYSATDVERIALLRQLTENGHAIGSLASLGLAELRALAQRLEPDPSDAGRVGHRSGPLHVVVVGPALAARLQRLPPTPEGAAATVVEVFDTLEAAAQARNTATDPIDLLLWQAPSLHDPCASQLHAARAVWSASETAVVYRFARPDAKEALLQAGAWVVREPADDAALADWLAAWRASVPVGPGVTPAGPGGASGRGSTGQSAPNPWLPPALEQTEHAVPVRRFDDAALTRFSGLSSGIACECPSHVAELLMLVSSFEAYSAGCANRSPTDAALHAHLQRVAGAARVLLEGALVKVAEAEGWTLS